MHVEPREAATVIDDRVAVGRRAWIWFVVALLPIALLGWFTFEFLRIDQERIAAAEQNVQSVDLADAVHLVAGALLEIDTLVSANAAGLMDADESGLSRVAIAELIVEGDRRLQGLTASDRLLQRDLDDLNKAHNRSRVMLSLLNSNGEAFGGETLGVRASQASVELIWRRVDFGDLPTTELDRVRSIELRHTYLRAFYEERLDTIAALRSTDAGQAVADIRAAGLERRAIYLALARQGVDLPGSDARSDLEYAATLASWASNIATGGRVDGQRWFDATTQHSSEINQQITDTIGIATVNAADALATARQRQRINVSMTFGLTGVACALFVLTRREVAYRRSVEGAYRGAISDLVVRTERDSLTGLWNRERPEIGLPQTLVERPVDQSVVVIYVDLDEFKAINDVWGQHVGDKILRMVASRLEVLIGAQSSLGFDVCRFGGDEFVAYGLVPDANVPSVADLGRRIIDEIAVPIMVDDRTFTVEATVGLTFSNDSATGSAEDLMLEADSAMIVAKKRQRGSALVYDREMRRDTELLKALPAALKNGEIRAYYQPAYSMATGDMVAVEALARWIRPDGDFVSPAEFVPLLESFGMASQLTSVMLASVASLQHDDRLPDGCRCWINVSAVELNSQDFGVRLVEMMTQAGVDSSRLGFELTETAAIRDAPNFAMALQVLRDAGAQTAIDDFGNGYSPLGYLRSSPIDVLKIDRSLVDHIDDHGEIQMMVAGIVQMMAALDIEVVAEGIERQEEFDWLASIGVNVAQGYLLARPMPVEELVLWSSSLTLRASIGEIEQLF